MKSYLNLLKEILETGAEKQDRTNVGSLSLFGRQLRYNLQEGFPILTTKKIHFQSVVAELLWFLRGDTNVSYLHQEGCSIWDEWADSKGDLGPIYGKQWRNWEGKKRHDQIQNILHQVRHNPSSRRIVLNAWNLDDLPDEAISPQENVAEGKMALAPCHLFFQLYVNQGKISLLFYARSQDFFLGTPFNIASYSLLAHLFALHCDLEVGDLIWIAGDVHLYKNHLSQAKLQLERKPLALPTLKIRKAKSIFDYQSSDFHLENYKHHPRISAPIAV
jgi:thymidylate synthase